LLLRHLLLLGVTDRDVHRTDLTLTVLAAVATAAGAAFGLAALPIALGLHVTGVFVLAFITAQFFG
jgi:hypothetical protein